MTPQAQAMLQAYRRQMARSGETITIRRGSAGGAVSVQARARIIAFGDDELVGDIKQGDRKMVVMAEDVTFDPPLQLGDRIIRQGETMNIITLDGSTRSVNGTLIAFEVVARG